MEKADQATEKSNPSIQKSDQPTEEDEKEEKILNGLKKSSVILICFSVPNLLMALFMLFLIVRHLFSYIVPDSDFKLIWGTNIVDDVMKYNLILLITLMPVQVFIMRFFLEPRYQKLQIISKSPESYRKFYLLATCLEKIS